jgi:NAD(P)-dependent dehydrogenase (short-subunit alcohol dehydrogenase family)
LEEVASEIRRGGGSAQTIWTDVSVETECRALIDYALEGFGDIDVLVCNAGGSVTLKKDEGISRTGMIKRLMDLNFMSAVYPGPVATGVHAHSGLTKEQIDARAMPADTCARDCSRRSPSTRVSKSYALSASSLR